MLPRSKNKATLPKAVPRVKYIFGVVDLKSDKKIAEYNSIAEIPNGYCNENKYKITYRKEYA